MDEIIKEHICDNGDVHYWTPYSKMRREVWKAHTPDDKDVTKKYKERDCTKCNAVEKIYFPEE